MNNYNIAKNNIIMQQKIKGAKATIQKSKIYFIKLNNN